MAFTLMNKDTPVARISIVNGRACISATLGELPKYMHSIDAWVDARTCAVGRHNVIEAIKEARLYSKEKYLAVSRGISLNDTFWVKSDGSTDTWKDISPYTNKFNRAISKLTLDGEHTGGNIVSPSPDYTLEGSADKSWRRANGEIRLYKTTGEKWSGIAGNRPYCEYYACQVAEALISKSEHFVKYGIMVRKTDSGYNKPYVHCKIFTSENTGFISYGDSIYKGEYLHSIDKIMDTQSRLILREMLLLDSILLNFDRHSGNYGFLVNNYTYRIESFAPIFDNDCSLGAFVSLQSVSSLPEAHQLALRQTPRAEMGGYIQQARWALTSELVSNIRNMYPFKFDRLPTHLDLEDERIGFMEYIVNNQIRNILK